MPAALGDYAGGGDMGPELAQDLSQQYLSGHEIQLAADRDKLIAEFRKGK